MVSVLKPTKKIIESVLVLPDLHAPFIDWPAVWQAHKWAEKHDPQAVVQLGDLTDQKAWSRWPSDVDDWSPTEEWERVEKDMEKLRKYFPEMFVLMGNHDSRAATVATSVRIPSQLVKTMEEIFSAPGWTWVPRDRQLVFKTDRGDTMFVHGDEDGGTPIHKATMLGMNVIQGHTHRVSIRYEQVADKWVFGAEMGHLMDIASKGARYAAKSTRGTCSGFGILKHGVPYFIIADGGKV